MIQETGFGHMGMRIGNSTTVVSCADVSRASMTPQSQRRIESISGPLVAGPTITLGYQSLAYRIQPHRGDVGEFQDVACVGETVTPFGATDCTPAFTEAKAKNPTAIVLNLYG